jgi:ATP-dependent Clp protease adaptor protein ClpS
MESASPQIVEDTSTDEELEPPYHVILLDDDSHTYQYVILMLGAVFGYGPEKGFAMACMVDNDGRAIVLTSSKEQATDRQRAIHEFGADPLMENCAGSMSAIVEAAD